MVAELVANAARGGCRVGVLTGNANSDVTSAVNSILTSTGLSGATTTITVNSGANDVSTAKQGDSIAVAISIPYNNISWIRGQFMAGRNISGSQTMRHE